MLRADAFLADHSGALPVVQPVAGVPTRTDAAFTNKAGVEKKGIRKDAEKALEKLAHALQRLLVKDEFVVYVAGACAPMGAWEQYTFGYFAQYISRVTLVFTNMRILALRVDRSGKWRNSVRACSLGDIKSAKLSGFLISRTLKLQYANGKKESYWALRMRDKTKLAAIMPKLLEANAGQPTPAQAMQSLCPTCAAALSERQYQCSGCGQSFRDELSLWWRSFIPGGAYFYAKQTGMGLLHAVVDSIIMIELALLIVSAIAPGPGETRADLLIGVAYVAFLLTLERLITLKHARRFVREFIPVEGTAQARTMAAAAGR